MPPRPIRRLGRQLRCRRIQGLLVYILLYLPKTGLAASSSGNMTAVTPCLTNADCPSGRMECVADREPGQSFCQCYSWLYATDPPRCKQLSQDGVMATMLMLAVSALSLGALYLHFRALLEHMAVSTESTDSSLTPRRWRLDCSRAKLLQLKLPFLLASTTTAGCLFVRPLLWVYMLWGAEDFDWWYNSPSSPYLLAYSLWAFASVTWVFLVVWLWLRVAAQLVDPRQPTGRGCLRRLLLNGTAPRAMVVVLTGAPIATVLAYLIITHRFTLASVMCLVFVLVGSLGLMVGALLLGSARASRSVHQPQQQPRKRPCCCAFRQSSVAPLPAADDLQRDGANSPHGGIAGIQRQQSPPPRQQQQQALQAGEEGTNPQPKVPSASFAIDFISASLSDSAPELGLYTSTSPVVDPVQLQPATRLQAVIDENAARTARRQGQTTARQSSSSLDLKLRLIQRRARGLAIRTALFLLIGAVCLLVAQACMSSGLVLGSQLWRQLGVLSWLNANLNCLYYMSPSLRRMVWAWSRSDWCPLTCMATLLDASSGGDEDPRDVGTVVA